MKAFTRKQFNEWLESQRGWGAEMEADGCGVIEDAVGDMAYGMIKYPMDEDTKKAIAFLKSTGVEDLQGCLADYLYDVAK